MLTSHICQERDFEEEWFAKSSKVMYSSFQRYMRDFKKANKLKIKLPILYHRKMWEFCYIYQALLENKKLGPDNIGLGFGVGKEPLASIFASLGCGIVATDLEPVLANKLGWSKSNQHSSSLVDLNMYKICPKESFNRLVSFENVNMNLIPKKFSRKFDFTWSSCSLEHCGNLELAEDFIVNQLDCLKDDGIAVHTTEFNLSSNTDTLTEGETIIFRKIDIDRIVNKLQKMGAQITIDYSVTQNDRFSHSNTDFPPYTHNPHLKLELGNWISTSIGLIIKKKKNFFQIFHW